MSAAERRRAARGLAGRSHQLLAGAMVADAVMDLFDLPALEVCPWALREGVILSRLDQIGVRLVDDQVGVLLVPVDPGPYERALRPHRPARGADVVERPSDQHRPHALALLAVVDLGVGDHHDVPGPAVGREAEHGPVAVPRLVAVLGGVVGDVDVGLGHGVLRGGEGSDATLRTRGRARPARIGLSTASVYPESTANGFELATRLGYDGVEVMVGIDPISQEVDAVRQLSTTTSCRCCAVHAPCLLITQRVWGTEPWGKLERSAEMAARLGADVVVVHPPFRWQRDYARGFVEGIAELEDRTGVTFAVENMYPWRAPGRELQVYAPSWDPTEQDYAHTTLDLSHSAVARPTRSRWRDAGQPAPAHPPDRRHRLGQGRAPGAGPRHAAGRRAARAPRRRRLRRARRRRDQHPQGGRPGGPASSTWSSRWRSPG